MRRARPSGAEVLRAADDRHDEPVVAEVDGDAEVDLLVDGVQVVLEPRVDERELDERVDRRSAR